MKKNLASDLVIKNLQPGSKQYYCMSDNKAEKGFGVLVYPTGNKTFIYKYKIDGQQRLFVLGDYSTTTLKEAREAYQKAAIQIRDLRKGSRDGKDPALEKIQEADKRIAEREAERKTVTVADFITDEYIPKYVKKNVKRWQDVERALNVEVIPRWGKRKITDITRRDIILLRDEIAERAPIMANRTLAYISGMFAYAVDKDAIKESPYANIKRAKKETPKERALSIDEIKQLWVALDGDGLLMSEETRKALKLILLTAQRPGEVIAMHSNEIDGHWWTIPGSRTKNGKTHRAYLTDTALELIGDLKAVDEKTGEEKDRGYIFPAGRGKAGSMAVNALTFALRRNIKGHATAQRDKVKRRNGEAYKRGPYKTDKPLPENPNRIGLELFGAHDLRRTAATLMAKEKVPYETRERVLNHTMGKLDSTYNLHDFDDEKQMAAETLERRITNLLSENKGANVVSISTAKRANSRA